MTETKMTAAKAEETAAATDEAGEAILTTYTCRLFAAGHSGFFPGPCDAPYREDEVARIEVKADLLPRRARALRHDLADQVADLLKGL